jgi:photosystem II stability/assembly factor-like uncharacterized protein
MRYELALLVGLAIVGCAAPKPDARTAQAPPASVDARPLEVTPPLPPLSSTELLAGLGAPGLSALRYRHIGPFRGGRVKAATGVVGKPGLFYFGAVNGGVFKSDDYGRTWTPIFDDQDSASIGAIAVAPSNPDVVYVGSGEGMQRPDLSTGDGLYRSKDGGKTWQHLGLRDGQQIPQIVVDPKDPARLYIAVLGHPYGPNAERGLYRSTNGGETVEKVLGPGPDVGAVEVVIDPSNSRTLLAALWEARQAPWENGELTGPGSGLYKSRDGGTTWRKIEGGLPGAAEGLGRIGLAYAPSKPSRVYATVGAQAKGGLYRSDDGGETWARTTEDVRVTDRADDFAEVKVHPRDPDTVFTASVVAWKSTDGGKTFAAFRGAPGGDDYQKFWIDPARPDTILLASDQGVVITVNGGRTWSSWYNQPTAQLFKVTADDAFPYRVCGGQQESGSACVASRGNDGAITTRDWHPASFDEYGYGAPDPADPDVVFGGRVSRWDRRTGQAQEVGPVPLGDPSYRLLRTMPLVFSPTEPGTLFHAANRLYKTRDGGQHWAAISPDLSRPDWAVPANVGVYAGTPAAKPTRRGVIYALAPSPLDKDLLWAGTDDGLLHVTKDGGASWKDVTPPALVPWAKVAGLAASRFDRDTAWAAINTLRLDDLRPHVLRTRDGGATWQSVVSGLPVGATVNAIREDPVRPGLLYLGTERAVFVSLDGGDSWASLRLNLPSTSVRDLIVKDDDLVLATHGRGFWILDDVTPLRRLWGAALAVPMELVPPRPALRVRFSTNTDTPIPPDEPVGENPPDGATLDYVLHDAVSELLTLQIKDDAGRIVRRYRSDDPSPPPADVGQTPRYWIRPAPKLARSAGLHRFVWDLHEESPRVLEPRYGMAAIPERTPAEPRGPWVLPGRYTVELVAGEGPGARTVSRPLVVNMDPRVKTPLADLRAQHALSRLLADALSRATAIEASLPKGSAKAVRDLARRLRQALAMVQQADLAPTPQLAAAAAAALAEEAALEPRAK